MFLKKAGLEKLYIVPYIWQEDREPREKRLWSLPLFLFYFFFYRALNDRCVCSRESVGHMWGCGKAGVIIWHSPNVLFLKVGEMCLKYPSSLLSSLMILSAGKVEEGGRITFQLFWLRFVCVCVVEDVPVRPIRLAGGLGEKREFLSSRGLRSSPHIKTT